MTNRYDLNLFIFFKVISIALIIQLDTRLFCSPAEESRNSCHWDKYKLWLLDCYHNKNTTGNSGRMGITRIRGSQSHQWDWPSLAKDCPSLGSCYSSRRARRRCHRKSHWGRTDRGLDTGRRRYPPPPLCKCRICCCCRAIAPDSRPGRTRIDPPGRHRRPVSRNTDQWPD